MNQARTVLQLHEWLTHFKDDDEVETSFIRVYRGTELIGGFYGAKDFVPEATK